MYHAESSDLDLVRSLKMAAIPIVDFSSLSLSIQDDVNLNEHDVKKTADELMSAFTSIGFVYLSNTGFPQQLVDLIKPMRLLTQWRLCSQDVYPLRKL